MDIERMFERGVTDGLFTDFDVCVRGQRDVNFSGGPHVSAGAKFFDVSSLTKAVAYLLMWRLFSERKLSPDDFLEDFIPVTHANGRQLWHCMSYLVQDYRFDYEKLRTGFVGPFKEVLLRCGFGVWNKQFHYDNYASAYVGLLLEEFFSSGIEEILHENLLLPGQGEHLLFHPVRRGLVHPTLVVPTRTDDALRGLVHDPLSFSHPNDHIVAAGLFSDATTIAETFHRTIDRVIRSGFYAIASANQLEKVGITGYDYSLGFDIPYPHSLEGFSVLRPLMFAGWTGCRVFFAERPRVTVCILTNRVFCGDTGESRKSFSTFFWSIVREVLQCS